MEVMNTVRYWMELTQGDRTIYPTFQDAAYEWLRQWKKVGCGSIATPLYEATGDTRETFNESAKVKVAQLGGGCHDEAMAAIRAINDDIWDVDGKIEAVRELWPKGCPNCGSPEIVIQEARTFSVLLDFSKTHQDTIEAEAYPGCNTTTYNCVKCGKQQNEG